VIEPSAVQNRLARRGLDHFALDSGSVDITLRPCTITMGCPFLALVRCCEKPLHEHSPFAWACSG
jgi:hypothetical protein